MRRWMHILLVGILNICLSVDSASACRGWLRCARPARIPSHPSVPCHEPCETIVEGPCCDAGVEEHVEEVVEASVPVEDQSAPSAATAEPAPVPTTIVTPRQETLAPAAELPETTVEAVTPEPEQPVPQPVPLDLPAAAEPPTETFPAVEEELKPEPEQPDQTVPVEPSPSEPVPPDDAAAAADGDIEADIETEVPPEVPTEEPPEENLFDESGDETPEAAPEDDLLDEKPEETPPPAADVEDADGPTPQPEPKEAEPQEDAGEEDPFAGVLRTPGEPVRTWIDNTGTYRTVARLVEMRPDAVRLLKSNGRFATVPFSRLSDHDRLYAGATAARLGSRIAERAAPTDTAGL